MKNFKQVVYKKFDPASPYSVHEMIEATLEDTVDQDKVLIRMICAPVHPCDTACAMGVINGVEVSSIGGTEGVGVIEQVGDNLQDKWQIGQRVQVSANYIFGDWVTWKGVWSEYVYCPDNALTAVPDGVDDDTAAQFMVNPLTAFAMVRELKLGPGNILLQTAAGSVLGRLIIQLSQVYNFETVNLARRQETADELKSDFDIKAVYVYDGSPESADRVKKEIANDFPDQRIDYCIEAVGGETALLCLDLLGPDGEIYIYGSMTGNFTLNINTVTDIVMKNNALKGWSTQETWIRLTSDEVKRAYVAELWDLLATGKLKMPATGQRFSFNQISEAMTASFTPGRSGKVMLDCKP